MTRVHKWAGLVIGTQIVIWFASGLFMTLFPIDDIRGRHLATQTQWTLSSQDIIPIELAMTEYDGKLEGASLKPYAGRPAYVLIGDQGTQILNALTGAPWAQPSVSDIRAAAAAYYSGDGNIVEAALIDNPPPEYRRGGPIWQVRFDDVDKTRLYLDAQTAELKAVRTRLWRIYDTMWMLHIMDYRREDDFNSWWLRLSAFSAFLFSVSGVLLLSHRFLLRPKRMQT